MKDGHLNEIFHAMIYMIYMIEELDVNAVNGTSMRTKAMPRQHLIKIGLNEARVALKKDSISRMAKKEQALACRH